MIGEGGRSRSQLGDWVFGSCLPGTSDWVANPGIKSAKKDYKFSDETSLRFSLRDLFEHLLKRNFP